MDSFSNWFNNFIATLNIGYILISAIISFILTFLGNYIRSRLEGQKKERENKLKVHFEEDLVYEANKIIGICSNITAPFGEIIIDKIFKSPQSSEVFTAHFPRQAAELATYSEQLDVHNKTYRAMIEKIKQHIISQGFAIGRDNPMKSSPLIYDMVFRILFAYWGNIFYQRDTNRPDFKNIKPKSDRYLKDLFVAGWDSEPAAYADGEIHREKCKQFLYELSQDKKYQQEAFSILKASEALVNQVKSFATQLENRIQEVHNYWPGTAHYRFRLNKKKCIKCKNIFG